MIRTPDLASSDSLRNGRPCRDDGRDHPVGESGFLPIRADEECRWIGAENTDDEAEWAERLRAWIAAELTPPRAHR